MVGKSRLGTPLQFRLMNQWREHRTFYISTLPLLGAMTAAYFALGTCDGPEKAGSLPPIATPSPNATSPTPAPTPTTASPTVAPSPSLPADLTPVQRNAATTAIDYIAAYDHAIRTGDTAKLTSSISKECPCRDTANNISHDWQQGGLKALSPSTVDKISAVTVSKDQQRAIISTITSLGAKMATDKHGKTITNDPSRPNLRIEYWLQKGSSAWQVTRVQNSEVATPK